ncbi:hypothetical protein HB976_00575 [Yersinia mollaretii]|uniref:acyltransferase n=1 Tax=Yersinia mollaretii TaxID=33060 RepID=UPI001427DBB3|nr:hypothetical protein [Yersinia mollaretii]MDA5533535.1 hypothetical protein [Yersinia mollaretii]NIL01467.1 hypothetical protein [Yersinia mollaretii]
MAEFKIINPEGNEIHQPESIKLGTNCEINFQPTPRKMSSQNNSIILGENLNLNFFRIIIKGHNNKISIGENTLFTGTIMVQGSNLNVKIGSSCTINGLFITCRDQDVIIGNECLISRDVKIRSSDTHKIFELHGTEQTNKSTDPVVIEDHVWIGEDVFIGKNSSIANGSIVAARTTVTKKITTPNCVIAEYNKIIRKEIRWEK